MDLNKVLEELQKYKSDDDRDQILTKYINERLLQSLNVYYNELDKNIIHLGSIKNDVRILKKMNKAGEQ